MSSEKKEQKIEKKAGVSHTHDHALTHSMVHYLLTIHKLKENRGYARVTDIAKDLGLTKGSVSTAVNNLKKKDLVVEDDSKFLSLSKLGHDHVHQILSNRTLLYYFFKDIVGISDEAAHKDSCLMEHLLSPESRDKLFSFMKNLIQQPQELTFETSLDLSQFESAGDFLEAQRGDQYLAVDENS